jgi:hypothetical protein
VSGALTGDVLPMGSPLSGNGVLRIHDPHRTSLVAGPSALRATAGSNRPALPTRIARWAMWKRLSHVRKWRRRFRTEIIAKSKVHPRWDAEGSKCIPH